MALINLVGLPHMISTKHYVTSTAAKTNND